MNHAAAGRLLTPQTFGPLHLPRRRLWQTIFTVLALIPSSTSILTLVVGMARFVDADEVIVALDSNFRFLGGVYLALALLALWCVVRIEERADGLVFVAGAIFLGGIGRLISIADVGAPGTYTWFVLVIELGALFLALAMRRSIRPAATASRPGTSAGLGVQRVGGVPSTNRR